MVHKKEDIMTLYLCLHKRTYIKAGINQHLLKRDFFRMLGEEFHVPKKLRVIILKEMENLGMLREINPKVKPKHLQWIKVNHIFIDPDETANNLYEKFKIF